MKLSFIGLGKLGLCSAACFAAKGHQVIGMDSNPAHIAKLLDGQCPIAEPGLPERLAQAQPNLRWTTDAAEAIQASDITLIIVPTPSTASGAFTNDFIQQVLEAIAPALRAKTAYHIVDIVSTVMPGSCDQAFRPQLERLTGKCCGTDFGLVYNPEFIALGSVIRDFTHPDLILIGASDARSSQSIRQLYASMVETAPAYAEMSLLNAELTKLSLNCFVTMKIAFANELAALCERMPGADVDTLTTALGADTRIGAKYLKGGLGFGGPCFPRDHLAFQCCAAERDFPLQLSPAVVSVNRSVPERLVAAIKAELPTGATLALFGLSYKAGTHIIEESQAAELAEQLLAQGYSVRMHDPQALPELLPRFKDRAIFCDDPYEAARHAKALIFLTDWPEYRALDLARLERDADPEPLLYDSWRCFKERTFTRLQYRPLGIGLPALGQKTGG